MSPPRQGTRSLAQLVPRIAVRALGRRGVMVASLITKWSDIVGPVLGRASLPRKLVFPRGAREGATLHVAVAGSLATELQHLEPLIVERINGFLGYAAVHRLKLVQDMLVRNATALPAKDRLSEKTETAGTPGPGQEGAETESGLEEALARLGRAVEARQRVLGAERARSGAKK